MKETQAITVYVHPSTKKLIKIRAAEEQITQGQYLDSLVLSDTQENSEYKGEVVEFPPLRSI